MNRQFLLLIVFFPMLFSACEKTVVNRGYVLNVADFSKISVGKDNAKTVFEKVGSPTIRSSVTSDTGGYSWYYISKKTEKNGFLDPKVVGQKTMIVSFDKNDIVRSVTESTYEKDIDIVNDKTKTGGKDAGILGETFGGLGKYMKRYKDK